VLKIELPQNFAAANHFKITSCFFMHLRGLKLLTVLG